MSTLKTPSYFTDAAAFIDMWMTHLFPTLNQPSVSLALAYKGEVFYKNAWGFANLETKEKATPEHIYRVASHSKSFTAFLVGTLVDEGKLSFDEPIGTYLPWLKKNKVYAEMTLRQVLSHGTGTARDGDSDAHWTYKGAFPSRAELKAYFLKAKTVIEPNTRFKYSNHGYSLAGLVLEEVTHKDYDSLIQEKIIKPLKLKATGSDCPPVKAKLCRGYSTPTEGRFYPLEPRLAADGMACVTGFHSIPSELCRFYYELVAGSTLLSRRVQKEILRPMWATNIEKTDQAWYCLGLAKVTRNGKAHFQHSGGYPGFMTRTAMIPELDISMSICTNSLNADTATLINSLFDLLFFFKDERTSKNKLSLYEGSFYSLWGNAFILAGNEKLFMTGMTARNPIENATPLRLAKGKDTFVVDNKDGYSCFAELTVFTMKQGRPVAMHCGPYAHTADYSAYLKRLQQISLK